MTFILQELRYPGGLIERYCINFAEIVLNKEGPNFRGKGTDGAIALLTTEHSNISKLLLYLIMDWICHGLMPPGLTEAAIITKL